MFKGGPGVKKLENFIRITTGPIKEMKKVVSLINKILKKSINNFILQIMKLNMNNGKKLPLVSIIMNCYNGEKYLKRSIRSVLQQKYQNWEIIFFDNCSTDKSVTTAKSFKNKRIKNI